MTGGTSGIGEVALAEMRGVPDTRVLLGAREPAAQENGTLLLDLSDLSSVRGFAREIFDRIGPENIDALVLNAGTQFPNIDRRTPEGFEETFAVNYLAHYSLLRLMLPRLRYGASVVITTSGTHDPKRHPLAPRQLDLPTLASPPFRCGKTGFIAGFRAYSASKLCCLMMALSLAGTAAAKERGLTVIAYSPGFIAGTSLFRSSPLWARLAVYFATFIRPMTGATTLNQAGMCLADLALGRIRPSSGRTYAVLSNGQLTWPDPSELARQDEVARNLWRNSARMVGLIIEA